MLFRSISVAIVALAAVGASNANAEGSMSTTILGNTPTADCAAAADAAVVNRSASLDNMITCDRALHWLGLTSQDRSIALVNKGILLKARGEYEAALSQFNLALGLEPNFPDALNDRGITLSKLHRYQEAEADFTHALALNPEHPETVYYNRDYTYEDAGDVKQAYLDYRRAARANPGWDKPQEELARFVVSKPALS